MLSWSFQVFNPREEQDGFKKVKRCHHLEKVDSSLKIIGLLFTSETRSVSIRIVPDPNRFKSNPFTDYDLYPNPVPVQ